MHVALRTLLPSNDSKVVGVLLQGRGSTDVKGVNFKLICIEVSF